MTGWGLGWCRGGVPRDWIGRGGGYGRGWRGDRGGHGWRHRYWATGRPGRFEEARWSSAPSEREWLHREAELLEEDLESLRTRLRELDHTEPSDT